MSYLEELKAKYPGIVPFEEDDDQWFNLGLDALRASRLPLAEEYFGKLCLAQPGHHDGYEGLACTFYQKKEQKKAEFFMQKALEKARKFLEDDSIDIEIIEEMQEKYERILRGKPVDP